MLKTIFMHNDFMVQHSCTLMDFISSFFKRNTTKCYGDPKGQNLTNEKWKKSLCCFLHNIVGLGELKEKEGVEMRDLGKGVLREREG